MPIIRRTDDPKALLAAAGAAGAARGAADRFRRQQAIDAQLTQQALAASQARGMRESFFDRTSRQQSAPMGGGGGGGTVRYNAGGMVGSPEEIAFQAERAMRTQEAEQAAEVRRRLTQYQDAAERGPQALLQLREQQLVAAGEPLPRESLQYRGLMTPSEQTSRARLMLDAQRDRGGAEFGNLNANERRTARDLRLGDLSPVIQALGERDEDSRNAMGELVPGAPTQRAGDARRAVLQLYEQGMLDRDTVNQLKRELDAAGQRELLEEIEQREEQREIANMISMAPAELTAVLGDVKAGLQATYEAIDAGVGGMPDRSPQDRAQRVQLGIELAVKRVAGGDRAKEARMLRFMLSDDPRIRAMRLHIIHPDRFPDPFEAIQTAAAQAQDDVREQ